MTMATFLKGKRFYLTGLKEKHLGDDQPYFNWLNDLSLDLYTERSFFPNNKDRMLAYYELACANSNLLLLGIFDNETDKHIGNITLQEIDWINRRAFIAYMLGDRNFAGKGIITDAVLMMMYYGYHKLNLERIWGGVSNLHAASMRICDKVGLKKEGVMRNHLCRNGEASDVIVVGSIRSEWVVEENEKARNLFDELPTYG